MTPIAKRLFDACKAALPLIENYVQGAPEVAHMLEVAMAEAVAMDKSAHSGQDHDQAATVGWLRGAGYDDAANALAELHVMDCALRGLKPLTFVKTPSGLVRDIPVLGDGDLLAATRDRALDAEDRLSALLPLAKFIAEQTYEPCLVCGWAPHDPQCALLAAVAKAEGLTR
jgi:hypothetical protein